MTFYYETCLYYDVVSHGQEFLPQSFVSFFTTTISHFLSEFPLSFLGALESTVSLSLPETLPLTSNPPKSAEVKSFLGI